MYFGQIESSVSKYFLYFVYILGLGSGNGDLETQSGDTS